MTVPTIRQRRTPPDGLGQALRAAREQVGLGLREAARQCGLSAGYLAHLEAGERCPSVAVAERLADVLQLGETTRVLLGAAAVGDAGRSHPAHARA